MYGYETVGRTLKQKLEALTDPTDTSEEPRKLFNNVEVGSPENISLYDGKIALIIFDTADRTGATGLRGQGRRALITGAILTVVPGTGTEAKLTCMRNTDIIGDILEDEDFLKLAGCTIQPPEKGVPQNWVKLDVGEGKKPKKCIAGATEFEVIKTPEL